MKHSIHRIDQKIQKMAAGPLLYKALLNLLSAMEIHQDTNETTVAAIRKARRAIARAQGK